MEMTPSKVSADGGRRMSAWIHSMFSYSVDRPWLHRRHYPGSNATTRPACATRHGSCKTPHPQPDRGRFSLQTRSSKGRIAPRGSFRCRGGRRAERRPFPDRPSSYDGLAATPSPTGPPCRPIPGRLRQSRRRLRKTGGGCHARSETRLRRRSSRGLRTRSPRHPLPGSARESPGAPHRGRKVAKSRVFIAMLVEDRADSAVQMPFFRRQQIEDEKIHDKAALFVGEVVRIVENFRR